MMLTLNSKISVLGVATVLLWLFFGVSVHAQETQSLSVTPPLFQIEAVPGQAWQSNVKIINTNSYPLTIYANPVNFAPVGEDGQGRFLPILENETGGQTLAEWVSVSADPITIPPEESYDIPFSVSIPANAPPGGHFAAILVGTKPPEGQSELAVRTSQVVSSLLFLRVAGDIREEGSIREFSVAKSITVQPKADFSFRFENAGNVHVQPQGEIKIFNMWGKERGLIPINHQSRFGNVLPGSIRNFQFSWEGERALSDIGKYTAVVTVTYGTDVRKNVSQEVSFWFIPLKEAVVALVVLALIIIALRLVIASYVRYMLRMAGIDPDEHRARTIARAQSAITLEGPVIEKRNSFLALLTTYRSFVVGIPVAFIMLGSLLWYVAGALTSERAYEVTIVEEDAARTINSEEAKLPESATQVIDTEASTQPYDLVLVNASGEVGLAALEAGVLTEAGYVVSRVEPDLEKEARRTVVVAPPEFVEEAKKLSERFNNALVSIVPEATAERPTITIYFGEDQVE